jgi:succinyl-diaminopimelate desuccinylase
MNEIKSLLAKLISYPSVTPEDLGCQDYMIEFFQQHGFHCQRFDNPPVANFFARLGNQEPLLVFAGHTDVVPIGQENKWDTSPFVLVEKDGMLYGRGSADMKGSLAAMMIMAAEFAKNHPNFVGSLGLLITSGEEGELFAQGTPYVMAELYKQGIIPDFCIVGEPTSNKQVGDTIKIGRRGSLTGELTLQGKQGHVAYPHLAENPIHTLSPALAELTTTQWDQGNRYFPPTSFQITYIHAGGYANNITPDQLLMHFNFRFSTEQSVEKLTNAVTNCFARHGIHPSIEWQLKGEPFLTSKGRLLASCIKIVENLTQQTPDLSTSGGSSDGRFIAPYGIEVVEIGPTNSTIHQVNECVSLADLETLSRIYYEICKDILLA